MDRQPKDASESLAQALDAYSVEGELYETLSEDRVRCLACAHGCQIPSEGRGICRVRSNRSGKLYVPWGYVSALNFDPIEKKPFYHVLPGARALTFGMLGCNFRCPFCQNWQISQILREPTAGGLARRFKAAQIVSQATASSAELVISSYNEPLITSEWAAEVFRLAREAGLRTGYVSNGYASPEVLDYLCPLIDCFKVDLKCMSEDTYRQLGGHLEPVLATIRRLVELAIWVEVVTLVVPGLNDSPSELRAAAEFLSSVSPDIPWHLTAFHADYHMRDRDRTSAESLIAAAEMGRASGLRYVYVGNLSGRVGAYENTRCPSCDALLVDRLGYQITRDRLQNGCCPGCQMAIPGIWK